MPARVIRGVLFDAGSGNRGAGNSYWYPGGEAGATRFAWRSDASRLGDFAATPAETTTAYLTTGQKDAALAAAGVPTSAVSR